jgi:hypothetical protein
MYECNLDWGQVSFSTPLGIDGLLVIKFDRVTINVEQLPSLVDFDFAYLDQIEIKSDFWNQIWFWNWYQNPDLILEPKPEF